MANIHGRRIPVVAFLSSDIRVVRGMSRLPRARGPRDGRGWAYLGTGLGAGSSVAANVAHSYVPPKHAPASWSPPAGAVVSAVLWPVILFVGIEVLARTWWPHGRRYAFLKWLGLAPVALVAAVVSYRHMSGLMAFYREDHFSSELGPLAIDGLMVVSATALIATRVRYTNDQRGPTVNKVSGTSPVPLSVPETNLPVRTARTGTPEGDTENVPSVIQLAPEPVPVPATTVPDVPDETEQIETERWVLDVPDSVPVRPAIVPDVPGSTPENQTDDDVPEVPDDVPVRPGPPAELSDEEIIKALRNAPPVPGIGAVRRLFGIGTGRARRIRTDAINGSEQQEQHE